jgi:hypothetical protein
VLTQIVTGLNVPANALARFLLAPIGVLPGWLSATIVAAATGLLLLVVFKYTSNQRAIRRVRDDIKAHLLAVKLFKDSLSVTFRAQGRILLGALRLAFFAVVPMLVMLLPVCLLLGQLALWYQSRPLRVGEEAVVTLKLGTQDWRDASATNAESPWPDVRLEPTSAAEVAVGPVRVLSKREICWNVRACENGYHRLLFQVDAQTADKELAIGKGFMRLSTRRPGWSWSDVLLHPRERPFRPDSPVESIQIDYPARASWTSGTDWWVVYWFAMSMVAALCFRPWLNVSI